MLMQRESDLRQRLLAILAADARAIAPPAADLASPGVEG
jgi:hypothetical protein